MSTPTILQTLQQKKLLLAGPTFVLVVALYFILTGGRYVSTDNAYTKAGSLLIASEVAGRVMEVAVKDNEPVEKGQLLFTIQPEAYQIALTKTKAQLSLARNKIDSMRAEYYDKKAELTNALQECEYYRSEFTRTNILFQQKASAETARNAAKHQYDDATQKVARLQQQLIQKRVLLEGDPEIPTEQHPLYIEAAAALDSAALDLAKTRILAPSAGVVAHVTLLPGQYVTVGTPLFSLIRIQAPWVEANFKETELRTIRTGQAATVRIDGDPGNRWHAVVHSITPATGSEFSLLPAQNSSGNWVKVVQRLMVRLEFTENMDPSLLRAGPSLLRAGMSATVTIDTKSPPK